ncbi:MAG: short-chain dehydrogenase/reductase [bacterium]|nr:short-chain dehydrogenase/reductase [bacterium]
MDKRVWFGAAAGGALVGWWAARRLRAQSLRDRVAVVTGATRGLGLRIATRLAEAGCPLAICARDEHEIKEAGLRLAGYGSPVMARRVDVSDPVAVDIFIDDVEAHFGRIDILVNNAGIIQAGPLEDMTLADFREALAVDFWGVVYASLAALPGMRKRRTGTIVNVTSIGGEISVPHLLPYSCAKAAARAFSEGLTAELGGSGIDVVTVVPWLMRTGSIPFVYYKGRHDEEHAMFAAGQLPILSVDADRAARRIVRAIERGEARVTIGLLAKLAREAHALAPGLLSRALGQARRFMPAPSDGTQPSMAVRGATLEIH